MDFLIIVSVCVEDFPKYLIVFCCNSVTFLLASGIYLLIPKILSQLRVCQEKEKKGGNDSNKNVTSNDNSRKKKL
jgi:hypothetical protein